jgi:hypothetical protein
VGVGERAREREREKERDRNYTAVPIEYKLRAAPFYSRACLIIQQRQLEPYWCRSFAWDSKQQIKIKIKIKIIHKRELAIPMTALCDRQARHSETGTVWKRRGESERERRENA